MTRTRPGRTTHQHDGELVVFLIGMSINRWWRPDRWLPVFAAMPRMLSELSKDPDSGLMGYRLVLSPRGPWLVQYWSSADALYAYASDRTAAHRPAWAAFNRRARTNDRVVGVWHETFVVDRAESIYVNSAPAGLAAATRAVPVDRRRDRARDRLDAA
ncbi:DUF4188 domain-containing protein [Aeromicrobium yanjiei]|uniref:DUF4188 domain-containing protein n=1 Tax=Aeromicrobium yanjiei TaxID=2662028 RepID=A0A5Q2MDR6_9ACTN|nr:DUF4188 domain-containing protein [Aeromicrobium yanjiei]QGG39993.1 DUF4188 domain-containing protein [Aeromicrobium yanjiei]